MTWKTSRVPDVRALGQALIDSGRGSFESVAARAAEHGSHLAVQNQPWNDLCWMVTSEPQSGSSETRQ